MAAEYEVNIKINTEKVETDLNTIDRKIKNLGKSTTSKEKSLERIVDKRARLMNRINEMEARGLKVGKLRKQMGRATTEQGRKDLANAQKEFRILERSIRLEQSKLRILRSQREGFAASPIRGIRSMMGSPAQIAASGRQAADPIRGRADLVGSPAYYEAQQKAIDRLARQGGPSDPVKGHANLVGSPKYFEEQQKAIDKAARQGGAKNPVRGNKNLIGSPAYFEEQQKAIDKAVRQGGARNPIRGNKDLIGSPAYYEHQRKELERLARVGGPASPIGGTAAMPGSPAAIAARRRRVGDIALGAGFPLLFGGGPGAVLGGALGGAAGGGLAAQIGLSAAGQQIDQMIAKAIELGQALNPAAFNLERVTEAAGFAGTETQNLLQKIEQYGDKAKAAELATELLRSRIGNDGVKALEAFGKQAVVLGNNLSVIFTVVLANIAKTVQPLLQALSERLGKTAAVRRFQAQDSSTLTGLDKLAFDILDPQLGTKGKSPFKLFDRNKPIQFLGTTPGQQLRNRAIKLGLPEDVDLRKFATERAMKAASGFEMPVLDRIKFEASKVELPKDRSARIKRENMIAASQQRVKNLQAEAQKAKEISAIRNKILAAEAAGDKLTVERLEGEERAAKIVRKKARLLARIPKDLDEAQRKTETDVVNQTILAEQIANQEETHRRIAKVIREEQLEAVKELAQVYQGVGDIVKEGLVDGIQSAIRGTKSLTEVLSNMFDRLSNKFMDLAANLALFGNPQGTLSKGSGLFGTIFSSVLPALIPGAPTKGIDPPVTMPDAIQLTAASGAFVSGPTRALIGEGGESEYVIPASKMTEAMGRYARGARGAAVIPEGDGTSTESGMNGISGVVDVRYSVERINNVDYVTAAEFERGMNQAAKRGAELGRQGVYSDLVNKRSIRSRVGV